MAKYISNILLVKIIVLLLIVIIFGLLSSIQFPWNDAVENAFVDLQFKIRGNRQLSEKIVLVFIGDEDIKALNGWPITRDYYGYLVYVLKQLGAKVIGIDVLFDSAGRNYPEYDQSLSEILASTENVCLPMKFSELISSENSNSLQKFLVGILPTFPIQQFRPPTVKMGFSNFDKNTIYRKVPLVVTHEDSFMLSFGCELARLYLGGTDKINIIANHIRFTDSANIQYDFPINRQGKIRLNHFGDIHHLNAISFVDLLHTFETNPDTLNFEDKIVIVAVTAPGVAKLESTPLSPALPATLIHATVAENLILQNYLKETGNLTHLFIILLVVAATWFIFRSKNSITIFMVSFLILLGYWIFAIVVFGTTNLILPLFYPTISFILAASYLGISRSVERRQQEDTIKNLLNEQIKTKESQLEEAKARLADIQSQLEQETTISEQTRQLAEERNNAIFKLEKELRDLQSYIVKQKPPPKIEFPEFIYSANSKMAEVLQLVATVSSADIPVLIMGETGTGKEMIARAIHNSSKRKIAPFVAINCGALPETLLESELFGHEKGSFTGAQSRRRGRFELANGGTIFLDEITETSPAFQTRLLRVLQESSFERLGGEQTIKVDVRVIAATNKDLQSEMEKDRFRSDLFYRLNGFPITLPPLRERQEDIPLLAMHFLKKHGYQSITAFSDRTMEILQIYQWRGNVRELENVIRRAAILTQSAKRNIIRESDLPEEILKSKPFPQNQAEFLPIEDQVLTMLRQLEFSRSAITQTAKSLGNKDRGTITEYFRGICFEVLVNSDFNIDRTAREIADSDNQEIIERVKNKITEYINNIQHTLTDYDELEYTSDKLPPAFKGLPKKYHNYLHDVIKHFMKSL